MAVVDTLHTFARKLSNDTEWCRTSTPFVGLRVAGDTGAFHTRRRLRSTVTIIATACTLISVCANNTEGFVLIEAAGIIGQVADLASSIYALVSAPRTLPILFTRSAGCLSVLSLGTHGVRRVTALVSEERACTACAF